MASWPRRALLDGHDRPVRVLSYDGTNADGIQFWTVLRSDGVSEEEVFVRGDRLTFLPDVPGGSRG